MSMNTLCLVRTFPGKKYVKREERRKQLEHERPGRIQYSRDVLSAFPQWYKHFSFPLKTPCLICSRIAQTLLMIALHS